MNVVSRVLVIAAVAAMAQPAFAVSTVPASANQQVSNGELLRFTYNRFFPIECGDASQAAADLRSKPKSDAATMHNMMHVYYGCANSVFGKKHPSVYNNAMFGFAAAALLAARHEGPPLQLKDANYAREVSNNLVNFTWQAGAGMYGSVQIGNGETPSMLRTNAGRIHTDAKALIAALNAQPAAPAASPAPSPAAT